MSPGEILASPLWQQLTDWATWQELGQSGIVLLDHGLLFYFLILNTQILLLLLLGFRATRREKALVHESDLRSLLQSPLLSPVSLLVPAYDESANIVESVRSLLQLRYPQLEVVVINDGSDDDTLQKLIERFALKPVERSWDARLPSQPIRAIYESSHYADLVVVDKENGGKADALNAGLCVSRYPLFCAIDGDSILEEDALLRVARPFHEHPTTMVAAGGTVRIANGSDLSAGRIVDVRLSRRLLPRIQVVEYLRAFLFGRMGWSALGGLLVISGAFGIFEKRAVMDAGGYASDTVGEDIELVIRMHRTLREQGREYRVGFVPEPVCWTEAPASLAVLRRQRVRWQRGLIESLSRHRGMIGRRRYGSVGLFSMPAYLIFEMLSPAVELLGYVIVPLSWVFGLLDVSFMLAFLSAAALYGIGVSVLAVLLDDLTFRRYPTAGQLLALASAAVVEAVAFRPLCAWWRVTAFWHYFRGDTSWGRMERRGLAAA